MRQIVLDTETTGLDPALGHRIIEIAAVEIVDRRVTDNRFHRYVDPERDSDEAALQIHGLTREFLKGKPRFREIADEFLEFVRGGELVIHNAAFDIAFIDYELKLHDLKAIGTCCAGIVDTLKIARELYPGKRNSLDSLCERHQVNNSARMLHGALLDAQLLAEVYLAMTRGQESLIVEPEHLHIAITPICIDRAGLALRVVAAAADELAAHFDQLADLDKVSGGACLWSKLRLQDAAAVSVDHPA
jgi:DNA polymerase-3 subunit epsilon